MSALISFLGGSVFRAVWGEFSHWFTAKQEHAQEIERLKLQEINDAAQHARNLESIRVQADLNVKVIQVQGQSDIGKIEAEGWFEAVKSVGRATGIIWIDAWNAAIRPSVATWAIVMLTLGQFGVFVLSAMTVDIACAALGIYLSDRNLSKRGK